jgi:hypothetical protein
MSRTAWKKRLKALENRFTPTERVVIRGGLPSGPAFLKAMAEAATRHPDPLCPALADERDDPGIDSRRAEPAVQPSDTSLAEW